MYYHSPKRTMNLPDNDITIINYNGLSKSIIVIKQPSAQTSNNKINPTEFFVIQNTSQLRTTSGQKYNMQEDNANRRNKLVQHIQDQHTDQVHLLQLWYSWPLRPGLYPSPFSIREASVDGVASGNLHANPSTLNTSLIISQCFCK